MAKRKIMLVDDDKNVLDGLSRILRSSEYDLVLCTSAMDAWNIITHSSDPVDVVVSDNKMPEVDGVDLLVAVKKKYPNTIRIMLTGESNLDDAQAAINQGEVYKFLIKPCNAEELKLIIKHALAHKDLWLENRRLHEQLQKQSQIIKSIEKDNPGITTVTRDSNGNIVINETRRFDSFDEFMKNFFKED